MSSREAVTASIAASNVSPPAITQVNPSDVTVLIPLISFNVSLVV